MNMTIAEKNLIIDEIFDMIEVLKEQLNSFKTDEERIPQIELDLCMENVRRLYEKLKLLDSLNMGTRPKSQPAPSVSKQPASIRIRFEGVEKNIPEKREPPSPTETSISHPSSTNFKEPEPFAKPQPSEEPAKKQHSKPKTVPFTPDLFSQEIPIIADKLAEEKPTLIDKLAVHTDDKSIVDNLTNRPLADLRAAIGINEKFLFVNELFGGSLQEYNQAVQALNQAGNLDNALEIFNSYQLRYRWNPKLPGVNKLKELIQRRYL
ncbi:MAG TPA: hypothetical protein PK028_05565 [Bacteroidales bacterium]|jgi:TolA-binding protein|nr:hypothetical protein [Bacteroidales bacterium]MDI9573887.1 hypothetical protein [Bacteroidota bacterium]OQC59885.1 MAG: hypothetical protein BWX51_01278 [Bacteroidetes bacterium ADurb.Bin012]MBP9511659.1 hypothetical protein [Bacteroidales bacterium]MBP9587981.1 hypothetical protein [Bacteroidales bacterium]